jgi:hydroxypyruvate reductase
MKPEILLTRAIYAPAMAVLDREYTVHRLWTATDPDAFVRHVGANIRGVVTTTLTGLQPAHMEALPKLEIIACFSKSCGAVDRAAAKRRGIIITNVPLSISKEVGELGMGLLISITRRIAEADRFVRAGKWEANPFQMGRGLTGMRCGILGLGEVGMHFARRAEPFFMALAYCDVAPKPDVPYQFYSDLAAMARDCDCLVVTVTSTPATRNIVNAGILEALGPDGFLVNVSRGTVVDQDALIAALRDKRIAGAALDVFADEPRVPAELRQLDNVVMTPHIGSSTREVREERMRNLLANLSAHFSGQPVLTPLP